MNPAAMHGATRVIILHGHTLYRQALVQALRPHDSVEVVLATPHADEALAALGALRPHVVAIEEAGEHTVELCRTVTRTHPRLPIAVLGSGADLTYIQRAFRAGATAWVGRGTDVRALVACLGDLHRDGRGAGPRLVESSAGGASPPAISGRERQILSLVAAGHGNRQIGRTLGISENTVRNHLANVFARLGVKDRTEAAVLAMRRGLL